MQAAETGISNSERACVPKGLANHLEYVQHRAFREGQVLGQISKPSQMASRCWVRCCLKATISIVSMSSTRILSSYPVVRIAFKHGPCPIVSRSGHCIFASNPRQ